MSSNWPRRNMVDDDFSPSNATRHCITLGSWIHGNLEVRRGGFRIFDDGKYFRKSVVGLISVFCDVGGIYAAIFGCRLAMDC